MKISPYLNFPGNAEEAMTFYASTHGHNNSVINGIGRIGARGAAARQEPRHHELHLFLRRMSGADHREGEVARFSDHLSVKVLGKGEITRALTVKAHAVSEAARKKIETAGGKVDLTPVAGHTDAWSIVASNGKIPM